MIQIAICDDDSIFANFLVKMIKDWSKRMDIKVNTQLFEDGSKLIDFLCITEYSFDIILLDMQMKYLDGIDTAKVIRKSNKKVIIIFITSHIDMVLHAFEVKAYRYLMKEKIDAEINSVLTDAIEEIQEDRKNMFSFSFHSRDYVVPLQDIKYFESNRRTVLIHLKDKILNYYGKLSEVEELISNHEFIRIHQSYIVNFMYVEEIKGYELILDTDETLPISKSKIKEVNRAFTWFLR